MKPQATASMMMRLLVLSVVFLWCCCCRSRLSDTPRTPLCPPKKVVRMVLSSSRFPITASLDTPFSRKECVGAKKQCRVKYVIRKPRLPFDFSKKVAPPISLRSPVKGEVVVPTNTWRDGRTLVSSGHPQTLPCNHNLPNRYLLLCCRVSRLHKSCTQK